MTRGIRQSLIGPPRAPCTIAASDPNRSALGVGRELNLGPRPAREPERVAREGGQRRWQRPAGCWWRLYAA